MCGFLAALLLLSVVEVEASKTRRRSSPLDRLKRRSATARWDELRHSWLPPSPENDPPPPSDSADPPAVDAVPHDAQDASPPSAEKHSEPTTAADPEPASPAGSSSSSGWSMPFRVVSDPGSEIGSPPWITTGQTGVEIEGLPPLPADDAQTTFEAAEPAKEPAPSVAQVPYQQPRLPEGLPRTASARDVLPKPITEILPYHDYAPQGEDPCEFLCPRPEGCPPDAESKPCPEMVELPEVTADGRAFLDIHMLWEPSNLFHNPLYFEDHSLERYGHTHNPVLQPFVSVGKFGVQLIGLPYQMALHHPCQRQFTLGWHRPGECVPYRYHLPPWNTKAAITAAAAYTGLIFLIP